MENGIIDETLSEQFKRAVGLRNILVHNYVYLKPRELYDDIKGFASSLTKTMYNIIGYIGEREDRSLKLRTGNPHTVYGWDESERNLLIFSHGNFFLARHRVG